MWFGVLGPVLVRDRDSVIEIPAGRQRVLLAALLLQAGAVVPADALAEAVWDGMLPAGAETTLRSHVMRLRRMLGPVAGARVVTRYPGYLIEAGEEEVDLLRFRRLCREGGMAARDGDWTRAFETLTEALGLWRGEPLADIPSELLRRDGMSGLEELRVQALEWRMDAGLHLGRHGELTPELEWLAGQHPLRERFSAQLMLALVRCGRQAEALQAYQRSRAVLVEELGTEPGVELRELHQRILTSDPALALAVPQSAAPPGGQPAVVMPRELPAPVAGFVGREEALAELTELLDRAGQAPSIVISAIGGTAGVGKTALAVQWAHRVADRFPDGQLYVNLRGYDPDRPMTAAHALAGFLRTLGVPGQDVPPGQDERAARYRSLLAGRRVLIVLDNAGSVEQVRPLLPGSPSCAVVVTSRDALAGLIARHGGTRLELDLLPPAEAVGLLRELIGGRVDDDPATAETIAGQCCRLPLALRVAAELAAARPDVPLADLAGELADQQRRLDLLDAGGDPRTAVRAVFSWSHQHLDPDAARAFGLLGLHPGPDFEAYAAAALTGTGLDQIRTVLGALARAHLIQPAGPDRHGMHDLLRAYARELAARDGEAERQAALTRLFDHYLRTAAAAMDGLLPVEGSQRRPSIPLPAAPGPLVTDSVAARAWLDAERAALVAAAIHAAEHGWPGHAIGLSMTLFRYLDSGGHYPEAIIIHGHALRAARRTGERAAEATALNALGLVDLHQSRFGRATGHFRHALACAREAGDRPREGRALGNLGIACFLEGSYGPAVDYYQQALALHRAAGERVSEAIVLNNLSIVDRRQGRYRQATERCQQAAALARAEGDQDDEAHALVNLGLVDLRLGRYPLASELFVRALLIYCELGNRCGEAEAHTCLGDVGLRLGRHHEALGHHRRALTMFREMGDRSSEAEALNGLGDVFLATGQPGEARAQHAAALDLAGQVGDTYEQARGHYGLARACDAAGAPGQALHHWRQALELYTGLGTPEADRIRARLAAADGDGAWEQEAAR
jgi:DNA-binding SARP family transcriptional activator/tetratricopeptide (TPR) repeat protein